jgi:hypothetical protein
MFFTQIVYYRRNAYLRGEYCLEAALKSAGPFNLGLLLLILLTSLAKAPNFLGWLLRDSERALKETLLPLRVTNSTSIFNYKLKNKK